MYSSGTDNAEMSKLRSQPGYEDPDMARIKLDEQLEKILKELHAKVDGMLSKVKETTATVNDFNRDFT